MGKTLSNLQDSDDQILEYNYHSDDNVLFDDDELLYKHDNIPIWKNF